MKSGKIWGATELVEANGLLEFHRIEGKAGGVCSKHKHKFKWNGFFVESGKLLIRSWKNAYDLVDETILTAGQYTKVPPGEVHQFEVLEDCVAFELYWAEFNHNDIERETCGFISSKTAEKNLKFKHQQEYIEIYKKNPGYGSDERKSVVLDVEKLIKQYDLKSLFDYGCGLNQMVIKRVLEIFPSLKCLGYDFAVLDSQCTSILTNKLPVNQTFDLAISSDCFEHIPKSELPLVWKALSAVSPKVMYHHISTRPAGQLLSDGSNAHATVETAAWWFEEMTKAFPDYTVQDITTKAGTSRDFVVLVLIKN